MGIFLEEHSDLERLYLYIYIFHMPAFIFVSGLFSKGSVDNKNYKKVFECIVLYLFVKCIFYMSVNIFGGGGLIFSLNYFMKSNFRGMQYHLHNFI